METGPYDNDPVPSFDDLYRGYCETLYGLDENIGRVLDYLDEAGLSRSTLVVYMGDNGFAAPASTASTTSGTPLRNRFACRCLPMRRA